MGTLICQTCNSTIDSFEDEKVSVLYSNCEHCNGHSENE
ncbi:GapA-binding peptide SR1P [Bacillus testis]|nr:GapA-binding peptide SR1P [Bacillus testis]